MVTTTASKPALLMREMAGPEKMPWVRMAYTLTAPADISLDTQRETHTHTHTHRETDTQRERDTHTQLRLLKLTRFHTISAIQITLRTYQQRGRRCRRCRPYHPPIWPPGRSRLPPEPCGPPRWPSSVLYE